MTTTKHRRKRKWKLSKLGALKAFREWLSGKSLRTVAPLYGISHNRLRYTFIKYFGPGYSEYKNSIYRLVSVEYLNSNEFNYRQKQKIREWLESFDPIELAEKEINYYTNYDLNNKTQAECLGSIDFRDFSERVRINNYDYH